MAKRRTKRAQARAVKRAARASGRYLSGGGKSRYAQKKAEQVNGKFRPTSPFERTAA